MAVLTELQVHSAKSVEETGLAVDADTFGLLLDEFVRDLMDQLDGGEGNG